MTDQIATKIASKIACVNGPFGGHARKEIWQKMLFIAVL